MDPKDTRIRELEEQLEYMPKCYKCEHKNTLIKRGLNRCLAPVSVSFHSICADFREVNNDR